MNSIPLQKLRYEKQTTVAFLPRQKCIIRVETARLYKWYLVLPAVCDADARAILVRQSSKRGMFKNLEQRIIASETERAARF